MINLRRFPGRLTIGAWAAVAVVGAVVLSTGQAARLSPSSAQTNEAATARPAIQHEVHRLAAEDLEPTRPEPTASETGRSVHPPSERLPPTTTARAEAEPRSRGDDEVLDRLWLDCEQGRGAACDVLFEQAPVGSDYEHFGLSCGARPEVLHCTPELDEPEPLNSYGQSIRPPIAADD